MSALSESRAIKIPWFVRPEVGQNTNFHDWTAANTSVFTSLPSRFIQFPSLEPAWRGRGGGERERVLRSQILCRLYKSHLHETKIRGSPCVYTRRKPHIRLSQTCSSCQSSMDNGNTQITRHALKNTWSSVCLFMSVERRYIKKRSIIIA